MESLELFQIKLSIFPEIESSRNNCQESAYPNRKGNEVLCPGSKNKCAPLPPIGIGKSDQDRDNADNLRDRFIFTPSIGSDDIILSSGQQPQSGNSKLPRND